MGARHHVIGRVLAGPFRAWIVMARNLRPVPDNRPAGNPYYDKSFALVIGVDDYADQPLRNAVNDARAVAEVLQKTHGFEVVTLTNRQATRDVLWDWLKDDLSRKVGKNDRLVIFFAGHGVTREGIGGHSRGYLVPHRTSGRIRAESYGYLW